MGVCLTFTIIAGLIMDYIYNLLIKLYETTGWDFNFIYSEFERHHFFNGILLTIALSLVCIFFSLVIGVLGAAIEFSKFTVIKSFVHTYIQFFRNTPPLIQMYFFYFGISSYLPHVADENGLLTPIFGAFFWAAVSLSLFCGAFNVEIFRSGIESVPKSIIESADALGYKKHQTFFDIVLPLAFRISMPGLTNNLVNLIKTTTLAYAIGVAEMLYAANQIWAESFNVVELMITLFLGYNILVGIAVWFMTRLEKKLKIKGWGD